MGWRDLLQTDDETVVSPWVGGRSLRLEERTWTIDGRLPAENGWFTFNVSGRKARLKGPAEVPADLRHLVRGYLVGDRFVADSVRVDPDPAKIIQVSEPIHLVDDGLDRFARVAAGRSFEDGPLIFVGQEMPLGPEEAVLKAYLDEVPSLDAIAGVSPALEASFRMEMYQRVEAIRRRAEVERLRREEEERIRREEHRRQLNEKIGDAAGRRELAKIDFGEGARAALAVAGAQYLDHRKSNRKGEMVVRFRLNNRRFECTCDERTFRIIDAGICLVDHSTDEKGDNYFTLESLPGVIQQAEREHKLVVFRHID